MNAAEKRRYPRKDVFTAALVAVGEDGFLTEVWDLSAGGARLALPRNWRGAAPLTVRIFFLLDHDNVISLGGQVVRVGDDHLGISFVPGQDDRVNSLLYECRFLDPAAPA